MVLNSPTLIYRFQNTQMSTWIRCQTRPVPNVVKFSTLRWDLTRIASSLVSRGFLGTLPGARDLETAAGRLKKVPSTPGTWKGWPVKRDRSVVTEHSRLSPTAPAPPWAPPPDLRRPQRVLRHEKLWNYVTWPAWENSNVFLFNWCLYSN